MRNLIICLMALAMVACEKPNNDDIYVDQPSSCECNMPHNEIWYTTTNAAIDNPTWMPFLEHDMISNTYRNGKGVMVLSGDITTIASHLFGHSYMLSSITLPCSVTSIGDSAFDTCTDLAEVNLTPNVEHIGSQAFYNCKFSTFAVPEKVTVLESGVFGACSNLTSIKLPKNLKTISRSTFVSCVSLKSVDIPQSVENIEGGAFVDCRSLREFTGKFASEDGRALIKDNSIIAFAPYGLTHYTIPNSVTTIGNKVFASCEELQSVDIPNGVKCIQEGAFLNCYGLSSITIPESVERMESECCRTYQSLVVYCKATTPPTADLGSNSSWRAFAERPYPELVIYVPMESVELYKSAEHWSKYAANIVGYDFE